MISSIDLAYIAGFFDGEGCISGANGRIGRPTMRISISQKRPEILYWIRETLDMGKIDTLPNYCARWRISGKKDTGKFINLIIPYSKGKKEQLVVGKKLNSLVEEVGGYHISKESRQERMTLYNRLKILKRGGENHKNLS